MKKATKKMAAKAARRGASRVPGGSAIPELYFKGHALLNTVRCIAQHEDRLCTLLHEMKTRGAVSKTMAKELQALIEELPAEEYAAEVRALEEELSGG